MKIELNTLGSVGLILLAVATVAEIVLDLVVHFHG